VQSPCDRIAFASRSCRNRTALVRSGEKGCKGCEQQLVGRFLWSGWGQGLRNCAHFLAISRASGGFLCTSDCANSAERRTSGMLETKPSNIQLRMLKARWTEQSAWRHRGAESANFRIMWVQQQPTNEIHAGVEALDNENCLFGFGISARNLTIKAGITLSTA
jgi:hypothetical protein